MPMCNLSKTMHNIWIQELGKKETCLYATTFYDYVGTFKQMTLYYHLKNCGQSRKRPHRDELLLHKTTHFGDLKQLENTYLKYVLGSSFKVSIAHMEGEKIFHSYKQKVNLPYNENKIHINMIMSIISTACQHPNWQITCAN